MKHRAVFLDRDGVINHYVYNSEFGTVDSPSNPYEFKLKPGVAESIARLRSLGMLAIVVSNQPGIAKGKFSAEILEKVTSKMLELCGDNIYDVFYCLHHPAALDITYRVECNCRKPKPGLLLQASAKWNIDMEHSFMVGDGLTDVLAGRDAGVRTILVNARKCYFCDELENRCVRPDFLTTDLVDAIEIIATEQLKEVELARSV